MQQRQCVVLSGNRAWCEASTQHLLANFNREHLLCLSDEAIADFQTLKIKQAQTQLGREFDAVVFDGLATLFPDNIGQSMGTVRAGGVFILWTLTQSEAPYAQRFSRIAAYFEAIHPSFYILQQSDHLPSLTLPIQTDGNLEYQTADQQQAIKAILKVAQGHRRRPLVLSADRGRGKSAALGMAAAQLLLTGLKRIVVTAPSQAAAEAVFRHATLSLKDAKSTPGVMQWRDAELRFMAPDELLRCDVKADILLVDEAAVIPSQMLAVMLSRFSRIVFSTTLHGYEGTGRGFAVRFQHLLDDKAPSWRHYEMAEPIRWNSNDALEAFSFEALLLNAEPVDDTLVSEARLDNCVIERLERQTLLKDEIGLRQLFGVMVLAHYRTRPSDLQLLMDSNDITLYVVRYQGHIVGSLWVVDEGPLTAELSAAVYRGKRRLKGHLLPQSLLAYSGLKSAGELKYQRVLRIAIHPVLRRKGLAKALIGTMIDAATVNQVDVVGTSFSADTDVMAFWRDSDFELVRLGVQRDDVSGQQSVTLLKACSAAGAGLVASVKKRFEQQWLDLLAMQFNQLEVKIVLAISAQLEQRPSALSELDKQDVMRFAHGLATYESCQVSIRSFVGLMLSHRSGPGLLPLSTQYQQLLVMRILQLKPVSNVVIALGFKGKSDLTLALRESLGALLIQFAAEDDIVVTAE